MNIRGRLRKDLEICKESIAFYENRIRKVEGILVFSKIDWEKRDAERRLKTWEQKLRGKQKDKFNMKRELEDIEKEQMKQIRWRKLIERNNNKGVI